MVIYQLRRLDAGILARPPGQKASPVWSKYIVVDKFARAIHGNSPEVAVAWAESELKAICEA